MTNTTTGTDLYEVYVEADEPWHTGLRRAFMDGVLEYVESNLSEQDRNDYFPIFDADAQLSAWDAAYLGYGTNAHQDADGFVFENGESAQKFADTVRAHVKVAGATVGQHRLETEASDDDED